MHHLFDVSIAESYGVNVAIFLNNIAHWIKKNIANNKHFYNERYWTYNTLEAWTVIFPYWTQKQVKTIIRNSIKSGLLLKANHNKRKGDRTSWFSLTDQALKLLLPEVLSSQVVENTDKPKRAEHKPKRAELYQIKTTDVKQKNKSICPSVDGRVTEYTLFDQFWFIYPRKEGKQEAFKIWKSNNLESIAGIIIDNVKKRLAKGWANNPKKYILMAKTYLYNKRWIDELVEHHGENKKEDSYSQGKRLFGLDGQEDKS